jgi:hypothetical protein
MAKHIAHRAEDGTIHMKHELLAVMPGITPGVYDDETRQFTPTGHPLIMTGSHIIESAAWEGGKSQILSGLSEDKGSGIGPTGAVKIGLPEDIRASFAQSVQNLEASPTPVQESNTAPTVRLTDSIIKPKTLRLDDAVISSHAIDAAVSSVARA